MGIDWQWADRTERMGASAIREILKAVKRPGMISLAGGIPAPESFPMDIMRELTDKVFTKYGPEALQYGLTEGFLPLREALSSVLEKKGITADPGQIMITSGSQGTLDALGKIIISPGDKIAVESPTYLGALQAFNPYQPEYVSIKTDDEGVIPEALDLLLREQCVKFVYLVPTFQNPTGKTLSKERREKIAAIIKKHHVLLVEDDPYSDIRYRGEPQAPFASIIPEQVIYIGTLSKTFAPGLRTGYFTAPESLRQWMVLAKQGIDLHTSSLNQALAAEYISGGYLEKQIPEIIKLYSPRQRALLEGMNTYFPDSFTWTKPDGGMFLWAEGPEDLDLTDAYTEALKENVAFVPGRYFFAETNRGKNTMRLNFTMSAPDTITAAAQRLGKVLKKYC